jgi:hypothetical protein
LLTQDFLDAVEQILRTERLGDIVIHLGDVQAKDFIDALCLGRDDDHRNVPRRFLGFHLLIYFPAIHVGHHQVEQHKIGQLLADGLQAFRPAGCAGYFEAAAPEDQPNQIDHLRLVFDAKNLFHRFVIHALTLISVP